MRSSWALVKPIKSEAASLFYARLFELDPALKPLFKGDMHAQGVLLMTMIQTAVKSLNNLAAVVPAVQALGLACLAGLLVLCATWLSRRRQPDGGRR